MMRGQVNRSKPILKEDRLRTKTLRPWANCWRAQGQSIRMTKRLVRSSLSLRKKIMSTLKERMIRSRPLKSRLNSNKIQKIESNLNKKQGLFRKMMMTVMMKIVDNLINLNKVVQKLNNRRNKRNRKRKKEWNKSRKITHKKRSLLVA